MKLATQDHISIMAICCDADEWMKLAQDHIDITSICCDGDDGKWMKLVFNVTWCSAS
jgi:hypothetical protein